MSRTQTQNVRNDLHLPGTEALAAHDDGGREGPRTAKDDTQPRGATAPASSHSLAAPLATGSSSSRRRRAPGRGERLRMEAPAPGVPLTGARVASRRSSRRGGMASAPRRSSSAGRWGAMSNTMVRERCG
jgi:hypothetical protein